MYIIHINETAQVKPSEIINQWHIESTLDVVNKLKLHTIIRENFSLRSYPPHWKKGLNMNIINDLLRYLHNEIFVFEVRTKTLYKTYNTRWRKK